MFPHAVRAVREIAPKAFIFENVKGLLRDSFTNYFQYIIHQLTYPQMARKGDEEWTNHSARLEKAVTKGSESGLKYNVIYQLLDAADYGVPQHRHRVLIVGIRSDLKLQFSFPQQTHEQDAFKTCVHCFRGCCCLLGGRCGMRSLTSPMSLPAKAALNLRIISAIQVPVRMLATPAALMMSLQKH